jgi:hypothetical protein
MEEVGFVPTGIALTGANHGLTGIAWNGKGQFLPDWTGLEWRKSVLARLEWPGKQLVSFGLTGIAWKFRKRHEERKKKR